MTEVVNQEPIPEKMQWLLAELTYACPLQCPYCSNEPASLLQRNELSTEQWIRVFEQAGDLGILQLGLTGGEPAVRKDLTELVAAARKNQLYTNLITSSVGLNERRLDDLVTAGLDHIQLSLQGTQREDSQRFAGSDFFDHKIQMARAIKARGLPLTLNVVLHRENMDRIQDFIDLAIELKADILELANTQYHGFARHNRKQLLPTKNQVEQAQQTMEHAREKAPETLKFYYVLPDYYAGRPKPCLGGWGRQLVSIAPNGDVLPCQSARDITDLPIPNVQTQSLKKIWEESSLFNVFRGTDWLPEPCASCPERERDFGGCRCQAYYLTGDASRTDPACALSPDHHRVQSAVLEAQRERKSNEHVLMRHPNNSRKLVGSQSDHSKNGAEKRTRTSTGLTPTST